MRKNIGVKPYMYPMPVLIIGTYDEESECMVGVIRNISVDEDAIDSFSPIAYDPVHGVYRTLGESVGKAFSIGLQLKK